MSRKRAAGCPRPLLVSCALLASCAPAGPGEAPRGSPEPAASAAPGRAAPATPDQRDVLTLVLSESGGVLTVRTAVRVDRARLGASARYNGRGRPTHAYRLLAADGSVLDQGDVVARQSVHLPPRAGEHAEHADLGAFSFVVRAPHPAPGETVEVWRLDAPGVAARWP